MACIDFNPCLDDSDVWMRPAFKSCGNAYYEHVVLCADDALVVGKNAESILRNEIRKYF